MSLKSLFWEKDEEKTTLKKRPLFISFVLLILFITGLNLFFSEKKRKSILATSDRPLYSKRFSRKNQNTIISNPEVDIFFKNPTSPKIKNRKRKNKKAVLVTHKKRQVIYRDDAVSVIIPAGKKIIVKLTNSIDTRYPSKQVLAIVPFAVKYKQKVHIPQNSTLLGKFFYNGKADRIFIHFIKCIFPGGREIPINAQALDSKDFQAGIKANHHSKATTRIAKSVALGMISPMAQTLTEKEALGQGFVITPKSNLKNAFLQGLARSGEGESKRQIGQIDGDKDYLTLAEGKEIIVNFLTPFKRDGTNYEKK
ncbi:MAG: hypothetical protein OXB84_08780 [Halobacteriovoraceae bacterium]|nr:hypothetical protein [Halobacteriovoraceae bacterium]